MPSLRRDLRLAAITALVALLTTCSYKDAHQQNQRRHTTSSQVKFQITLNISPDHPRMIKPTVFAVHITDANGKPADNLTVTGSLTMRAMNMGVTSVAFTSKGNGDYEGSLKELDMSGPWTLTVDASAQQGHAAKSFDFAVGE